MLKRSNNFTHPEHCLSSTEFKSSSEAARNSISAAVQPSLNFGCSHISPKIVGLPQIRPRPLHSTAFSGSLFPCHPATWWYTGVVWSAHWGPLNNVGTKCNSLTQQFIVISTTIDTWATCFDSIESSSGPQRLQIQFFYKVVKWTVGSPMLT